MIIMKECVCLIILMALLELGCTQMPHRSNIFLTEGESYLFFPHRHFQSISTYTSKCSAKPKQLATAHPAMAYVASFPFNNTNLAISILSEDEGTSPVFQYAKLNPNGVCSVYEVQENHIQIIYEYNFGLEFNKVVQVDRFRTFLWNCQSFALLEYSLLTRKKSVLRGEFGAQGAWNCEKYKQESMVCWEDHQILLLDFGEDSYRTSNYSWNGQMIVVMMALDYNEDIFFICSFALCNISKLVGGTVEVIDTFPSVQKVMGGDYNLQTNQIVVIFPSSAIIYTYNARQYFLQLEQSVDYYSDLQCVFLQNVRFLNEEILINCNNFMGEAEHLALIKDRQLNRFYSYQPLQEQPKNPCIFDGNKKYIFALCKAHIATMTNNFAYFQIPFSAQGRLITIDCLDFDQEAIKIPQNFQVQVVAADYGEAYVNQLLWDERAINYEDILTLKLKDTFTASAIDYYTLDSPNCPYLQGVSYPNIQAVSYLSLYVRERCVQVVAADTRNFYRVLELNQTLFYIEICTLVKVGFGCQLYDIKEGVASLRLFIYDSLLFQLYLRQSDLVVQGTGSAEVVFRDVTTFEMRDQVVRVRSRSNRVYSNSVSNVINNSGKWIEETEHLVYRYGSQHIFTVDSQGKVTHYLPNGLIRELSLQLSFKTSRGFSFPYLLSKGYYVFVINETHIIKVYELDTTIVVYQLPYNNRASEIQSIHSVDNYIVIQYSIGFFEIYDTQRESVAALIAAEQEEVLCDIVLMDRDVILVPLKAQNYMLRIQTDPTLLLGPLPPFYDRFHQRCIFSLRPHLSNGSCPKLQEPQVQQNFVLNIQFNIQKIDLLSHTLLVQQPYQCDRCLFQIQEEQFRGPIFTYEFNDDDSGTFQLVTHLSVEDCEEHEEGHLLRMVEVPTADENTRNELLMVNETHLLLLDQDLNEIENASHPLASSCLAYTQLESQYLLFCHDEFLLFVKGSGITSIPHNLTITESHYELKSEPAARDGVYYLYIREGLTMHILLLCLNSSSIEELSVQALTPSVWDFVVVRQNIITLQQREICIKANFPPSPYSDFSEPVPTCFPLNNIVPSRFAHNYDYQEFLPYHTNDSCMRALLISGTSVNLHVDLEIDLSKRPIRFTLLNVYAGYIGFELMGIVSINAQGGTYSNFILQYQDTKDSSPSASSLIAYYQFNPKFSINEQIGQIRSALFLSKYFENGPRFSFLSFPKRLYITNFTQLTSEGYSDTEAKRFKKCVSTRVEDKLQVMSSYIEPSLLQFLILKVKNINDLQTYYIKFHYDPQPGLLLNSFISLAVTTLFFALLVIATNRCKDTSSELTIHFMSEEVEREFSQEDGANSDLIHSNTSNDLSSPRSLSPAHSQEDLD